MNRTVSTQAMRRFPMAGALGLCLLLIALHIRPWRVRPGAWALAARASWPCPRPPRDVSEAARRAGWHCWVRARLAMLRDRDALEAWDPQALAGVGPEVWRLRQLAADRTGALQEAWVQARRAAALARSADERYRAALLRVFVEHDAGRHAAELREARVLMALAPRDPTSRACLRRALRCSGLRPAAQQTAIMHSERRAAAGTAGTEAQGLARRRAQGGGARKAAASCHAAESWDGKASRSWAGRSGVIC